MTPGLAAALSLLAGLTIIWATGTIPQPWQTPTATAFATAFIVLIAHILTIIANT